MRIKSTLFAVITAAFAACAAVPALAQSAATASLGSLTYHLIDLDPADGITPWISLSSNGAGGDSRIYGPEIPGQIPFELARVALYSFAVASYDTSSGNASMLVEQDRLSASIEISNGQGYTDTNHWFSFTVSPHTQVVFSSSADLWGAFDPGAGLSEATAHLDGWSTDVPGGFLSFGSSVTINAGEVHTTLSATANNIYADPLNGYIALEAGVSGQAVSPVPEPASAAMLAGGLALIAGLLRRRSARP